MDVLEKWLGLVAYENSGSPRTEREYRRWFNKFCKFIGETPEQILAEYENSRDRDFRVKYASQLNLWIASLKGHYAKMSIRVMAGVVQSFFKHNNLPMGYVARTRSALVKYHNRDITKEEITLVLGIAKPRERAYFTVMAQSGLRPVTLNKLKLKHLEPDWSKGTIPCKIDVPQQLAKGQYHSYFTFIGDEAVEYLRAYLNMRENVTKESWLFAKAGKEEPLTPRIASVTFYNLIRRLKRNGQLEFEERPNKPAELRLYCLRKFFKKHTYQAGAEFNEFWMGHKGQGVIDHYRTRDPEFHRKLYAEKAAPHLRIEKATPTETEQTIMELKRQLQERDKMITVLKPLLEFASRNPEALQKFLNKLTPKEKKAVQSWRAKAEKWIKDPSHSLSLSSNVEK